MIPGAEDNMALRSADCIVSEPGAQYAAGMRGAQCPEMADLAELTWRG